MRLLDRYLLRELVVPFAYCLAGFLIFWVSTDLLNQMSEYQKLRLRARDLVELYGALSPGILVMTLPIAFLLALLYALTHHARHHELTAIRAAGVSLFRMSLPYLGMGLLLSVLVGILGEFWVPIFNDKAEEIQARHQTDKKVSSSKRQWEAKLAYYNPMARRWWFVESYHRFTGEMVRPRVVWMPIDSGQIDIIAERGVWTNGVWVFTRVHRLTFPFPLVPGAEPAREELAELSMPEFEESPDQFRSEIKMSRLLNFKQARKTYFSIREILEYYELHPAGIPPALRAVLDTKLHGQMAAPWTSLVVVPIALAFGARSGRRNVAVGVASSIFICFAYFVLQQISLALGGGGHVAPWMAAWAPNVVFGLTGMILCWRLR